METGRVEKVVRRDEGLSGSTIESSTYIHDAALLLYSTLEGFTLACLLRHAYASGYAGGKTKPPTTIPSHPPSHHRANTPHRANTYVPSSQRFFSCSFSLACEIGQEVAFLYPAGRKFACVLGSLLVQNRQRPSIPAGHPSSKCTMFFLLLLFLHDFSDVADHVRELCRLGYRLSR